jgi:hypothetical protein
MIGAQIRITHYPGRCPSRGKRKQGPITAMPKKLSRLLGLLGMAPSRLSRTAVLSRAAIISPFQEAPSTLATRGER